MYTYTIYTNKRGSFIVPTDKVKLPKDYTHSYDVDSPVEICNRKVKLAARVTSVDGVVGVLKRLATENPEAIPEATPEN